MEKNFSELKVGRWYVNRAGTAVVQVTGTDDVNPYFPFKADFRKYSRNGNYNAVGESPPDLIHELPEGWEPMGVVADNATTDPWPERYEVGMRFLRADGVEVFCRETFMTGAVISDEGIQWRYHHGDKGRLSLIGDEKKHLTKWLNPPTEQPKPEQIDRNEMLRVATALAAGATATEIGKVKKWTDDGIETQWDYYVADAIALIQAVNERCKGGTE